MSSAEDQADPLHRDPRERVRELEAQLAEARRRIDSLTELAGLETRAQLLRDELQRTRERLGEVMTYQDYARELRNELTATRRKLQDLQRRRAVRIALKLSRLAKPPYRFARQVVKRARGPRPRERRAESHQPALVAQSQEQVAEGLRRLRPDAHASDGPLVSICVLTRDGREHMERMLTGLRERTAYRSFEVVVVDNASSDDTLVLLRRDWGFPIRVIRNEENTTFSVGNNQAIAEARGEFVLLLNNDVAPINEGWLGAMVATLTASPSRLAVGALLVYPDRGGLGDGAHPDLTVQHAGIAFQVDAGAPRARNLLGGTDPLDPSLAGARPVPAVTAACMLARKRSLHDVGGFTEGFVYGTEDVDLCLKLLAAGGEIWFCGEAALFHYEYGTQSRVAAEVKRENRRRNWQLLAERWGPQLVRTIRLAQLQGDPYWVGPGRTVAITITQDDPKAGWGDWYTAHALGDAFAAQGWTVRYAEAFEDRWYRLGNDVQLLIALHDRFDVRHAPSQAFTIAWVRNWTDRWLTRSWFETYDLVVASSERTARIVREASLHDPPVLPLAADHRRFRPLPPDDRLRCDYSFTGNRWSEQGRDVMQHLEVRPGERFSLYGKGWGADKGARRWWRGFLDYERLPQLYSSSTIVLDDTAGPTLPYAALNSRAFEALAAGALVLTDNIAASFELFDGLLPTYTDARSLRAELDRFLGDERLRRETAERLRNVVLERHTYERRAAQFVELAGRALERPRVALKIAPTNARVAKSWGDTHFARDFARALRDLGFRPRIDLRASWDDPGLQDADVVVQLRGLHRYRPKPAHLNLEWIISHPEDVEPAECEAFDAIFIASAVFTEQLRQTVTKPVFPLYQATDTQRFRPVPASAELRCEILFVGNSREQLRPVVRDAIELGLPLAIYGSAWEQFVPEGYVRATYFPNERLRELYSSACILLADHWEDMARLGFVSNRIFDALACGTFVLSDAVAGMEEMFGGAVPQFRNKDELAALVERYRNDADERRRLATHGMELVRKEHSFDARAEQFAEAIAPLLEQRPRTIQDMARAGVRAGAPVVR